VGRGAIKAHGELSPIRPFRREPLHEPDRPTGGALTGSVRFFVFGLPDTDQRIITKNYRIHTG
jgi:hypothetical protein